MTNPKTLNDFSFPRFEYWFNFKGLWRERGPKAIYKQFQRHLRRPFSRDLVTRYSSPPKGRGLEIGVGARTIAPVSRTVLADGYESHGNDRSIAQVYFPAAAIPFAADMKEVLEYMGFEVVYSADRVIDRTDSFVVVGRKKA